MKLPNLIPTSLIIGAILGFLAIDSNIIAKQSNIQIQLVTSDQISGGERSNAKFYVQRTAENRTIEYTFKLSTNNPSLIQFDTTEVKLLPGEERAEFKFQTLATPIKNSASIKVQVSGSNEQGETENFIEIVPAMLKSIFVQPSMTGTHGAKVEVSVELKATAPTGGIQIYLSHFVVTGVKDVTISVPTIQVTAGSTKTSFMLEYDAIKVDGKSVSKIEEDTSIFNQQKRTVEFVVALDPQQNKSGLEAISGFAIKTKFSINPLQISAISVQPSQLIGGNEALGSFTLNAAPGNGEIIYFKPRRIGDSSQKLWVVRSGSSCLESTSTIFLEIPLTQGVTNYNFKVCSATVAAPQTVNVETTLRSGVKVIPVTVQP